jgi:predicted nucleotidyltransferase
MPLAASQQPIPRAIPDVQRRATSVFNPEFDLLLACCTNGSKIEGAERTRETLTRPLDWKRVINLAKHHGVVPQVYRSLSDFRDIAPPDSIAALRHSQEANARHILWLTRELLHILEKLESCRVAVLPYKGPILAEILYGNVSMRQFSDLDLLIHSSDLPRIKSALAELGYEPRVELTQREERDYLESGYEHTFDHHLGRNLVEVQWRILPRFYSVDFDVDGFFQRAVPHTVSGMTLRTLCAEDLLLVLCVHAAKHAWQQLSWLCDIAELVLSQQIDWNVVEEKSKRLGIQRIVAVSLSLANRLLEGAPSKLCLGGAFGSIENLTNEIIPTLAEGADHNTESISYFWLMIRVRERSQDRIKFLWRLILTPSIGEWSAIRLPAQLFPLYRVVRIFRLLARLFT